MLQESKVMLLMGDAQYVKKTAHNYLEHIILKKTPPTVDKVFAITNFDICLDRLIKQLVSY